VIDTEVKEREGVDRNLPDGWKWVKLKEICERIDYGFTASADFSITEPRFLRITDIQNGQVNWTKVPGCKISFREEETNKLIDGDIVFARTGGTTGKSFLIKQPPRSVFASYLIRLRLNNDISAEYIYAFLQSNSYWQQIRQSARGGAQPNVNAQLLGSIILPLPPLAEQKRIAAILNEQMEAVEKARKATEAQLESAKELPAAYLRAVFNSPEAQKWRWVNFEEAPLQIIDGDRGTNYPKQSDFSQSGYCLFLNTGNVTTFGFNFSNCSFISQQIDNILKTGKLQINDIVLTTRGTVGNTAWFNDTVPYSQIRINSGMVILRSNTQQVLPNFLCLFIFSYKFREQVKLMQSGSAQPQLPIRDFKKIKLPIPSLFEQKDITVSITEKLANVENLENSLKSQLEAINQLPSAILRKAFNGQL
jgi:type I restriction enzyme S subunit